MKGKNKWQNSTTSLELNLGFGQSRGDQGNIKRQDLTPMRDLRIYVGRVFDTEKHSKEDNWVSWGEDIETSEKILIYKYSPNYNTKNIYEKPVLPQKNVRLIHTGHKNRLHPKDNAPKDYT